MDTERGVLQKGNPQRDHQLQGATIDAPNQIALGDSSSAFGTNGNPKMQANRSDRSKGMQSCRDLLNGKAMENLRRSQV